MLKKRGRTIEPQGTGTKPDIYFDKLNRSVKRR